MVLTAVLLLAVLFLAGLINIFFNLPASKFSVWLHSLFKLRSDFSGAASASAPESDTVKNSSDVDSRRKRAELKRVFATFDKNSDGFITKQELKESLKNIRIFMSDAEVEETVAKVDANGDGLIDFDEFCVLCESTMGGHGGDLEGTGGGDDGTVTMIRSTDEELKGAFDVFDKDKDGLISVEELGVVLCSLGLREGNKMEDCKEMVRKVDRDGDGKVNFDEFKMMMKGGFVLAS